MLYVTCFAVRRKTQDCIKSCVLQNEILSGAFDNRASETPPRGRVLDVQFVSNVVSERPSPNLNRGEPTYKQVSITRNTEVAKNFLRPPIVSYAKITSAVSCNALLRCARLALPYTLQQPSVSYHILFPPILLF